MVNIRPLNPSLQEKAIKELNEDPERIRKDLAIFKEWIRNSPHIKARDDDQFLVNFLRTCKFSMEKAKEKFEMYHTLKSKSPELLRSGDPLDDKVLATTRQGIFLPLPNLESPDGPRYFLVRFGMHDPTKFTLQDVAKVLAMISELMQEDDNVVIAGRVEIVD